MTHRLDNLKFPIVQLSLDLTSIDEALETAAVAVAAGVDWLEAGTPLLLAEGLHAVERLRARFPDHPIVADLKTMDGGYLEAEMMAKAGANLVVVMGRAHEATIRRVVDAGRDFGDQGDGRQPRRPTIASPARNGWRASASTSSSITSASTSAGSSRAEPARRARRGRARGLHPGAGGRRPVDPAGD